jgi:hypothetical protein
MPENITQTGPLSFREIRAAVNSEFKDKNEAALIETQKLKELNNILSSPQYREEMTYSPEFGVKYDYTQEAIDAGLGESKYDDAVYSPYDLENVNEVRSREQSGLQQLINGLGKGAIIAITTVVDNFLGTAIGLVNLGIQGSEGNIDSWGEGLNAFVDNPVSRYLQKVNNMAEEWMPNYTTEWEQNTPWWQRLGTANFWGDHFLKNTGFFVGAYLSGMGNAKMLTKAMQLDKMKLAFKGVVTSEGKALQSGAEILKAYKTGDALMDGAKLTDDLVSAAKNLRNKEYFVKFASGIAGSFGESRMEALSGSEEDFNARRQLLMQAKERDIANIDNVLMEQHPEWYSFTLPTEGQPVTTPKLTSAEGIAEKERLIRELNSKYEEYERELANERIEYANKSFLINMAITSADNIYQFGDAFTGGFTKARQIAAIKKLADGTYAASKRGVVKGVAEALGSPVFEGTQEMLQRGTQLAGERWNASKFNEFYGAALDPKAIEAKENYFKTWFDTVGDTYSNPEEWENFFLGAITSLLPMPGSSFYSGIKDAVQSPAESKKLADSLNDFIKDDTKREWLLHLARLDNAERAQELAKIEDDRFTFKNAETDKAISSVITYTQAGKFQDFLDLVEAAYTVQESDIDTIKSLAIDKETGKSIYDGMTDEQILEHFNDSKKDVIEGAKNIHETYNTIAFLFGDKTDAKGVNTLTYLTASIDNREERIAQITQDLIDEINADIDVFEQTYGYSPVERLKDIQDLKTWFSDEDKKELLEYSLGKRNKEALHNAEVASKRLDGRQKRRQVLQGRKLGNTKLIERLEAKKTTEGLTEEENQKLQKAKRKVREAERQIPEVRGVIEDLKKFISEETTKSNTQQKASLDKLEDLYYLLTEREALVDSFNNLQKNPEKLEESLNKDLNNAVNSYNKRKSFKLYNSIKKSRNLRQDILKSILEGKTNFDTLISIAEEQKDDKFKNEVKTLKELNDVAIEIYGLFESEETQIPINETTKPYISAIQNQLDKTIWDSPTAKEARQNVEDVLDVMIDNPNKIISDLATIIKKEYTDNKKDNQGTSKNKKRGSSKSKKSEISDAVKEMIAKENYEDVIRGMTREELEEFINSDGGLLDYLTGGDIELSDYEDEKLAEEVINYLDTLEDTEDSDKKSNFSKGAEEDEDEDEDEEDDSDEDEDEDGDIVKADDEVYASDESKKKKSGRGLSSKTKILPPNEVPKDQKKIIVGDNNEGSESNLKVSDITDAWHGNRNSSKYVINDLKKGKLTINDWFWYNNYLNQKGINHQEFIDSGELQRLKEYYESIGEKCSIHFVKIKYKREDDHLFAELRDNEWWEEYKKVYADGLYKDENLIKFKNIVLNNTVFLAVEKPDGFDAKDGTFETFVNSSEGNKKVQLIGVADSLSKDVRELINSEVKDLTGHIRMANVSSTLEWVFSGRLVKETETIEKDERDLRDIVNEDSAEGILQIEIITPSDNITIGEDLEGEVVPLNIHRENIPITNKSDRYGTIWIKTKEADGRIYYKGVKIKAFDSNYTDTDSKIYKAIKKAVKAIVVAEDKNTAQNALNDLKRHLYFEGKTFPIFKNIKDDTLTFNDDDTTIDLSGDVNEAVDAVMEAIQSRGYTFAVGLNGFSLDDVIQSNILLTDLAQLHNANSSFIFSKIEVDESGDWWITPSEQIPTKLGEEIHLGEKGLQDKKGYVNRVKLNGTFYSQRTDGIWAKYEGGEYISVEDELNANDKFRLQLLADIKNEKIKPSGWYPRKKGKVTMKVPVYTRENPNKANTLEYVDKDGNFLTQEQIKAYNDLKSTRNEDKKKAARKKLDAIGKNKKITTKKTKNSEGEEKTTVESVPLPSGKNTKGSSIEVFETEDGFETIIKRRNGNTQEGKYIRTEDEDGFIKYTLDGSYTTGIKVTAETLGLTIDELIGGRDSFNSQEGYEEGLEAYEDGAVVMQIVIRPDGTYSVSTDVEGLGVEGDAAERIYEKFKEWAKPKKRQSTIPEGKKPAGKRGVIPGQNFHKQSSGNPVIDRIVELTPKSARQWLIDNKINKQELSNILKDLLDKKKISSDMLSELLASLQSGNIDNKANSLLDNIMNCR